MAKLPSIRRFYEDDYKTAPEWFKRFINNLNLFSDPMVTAIDKGLDATNLNNQIYSITLNGSNTSFQFTKQLSGRATGLMVIASNLASNIQTALASPITINSWYQDGSNVYVTKVSGMTANTLYNLTVLLF